MRKTLTYSSFIVASVLMVFAFVTATNYSQLAIAILLYPLIAYFGFKILPRKTWKAPVVAIRLPARPAKKVEEETAKPKKENIEIADIDKRAFLKMIGAAGLSFFLFSLLNRKTETLFFGKGITGTGMKILDEPAGKSSDRQPTDGYRISEIDDDETTFYGFTNKEGGWFIMKEDTEGSFRYTKGESNFTDNWKTREGLKYDYFYNVF